MAMEKEALTHKIEDDLAARNRNWDKIDAHLAEKKFHRGYFVRNKATASGTQIITGVGFEPSVIIFISVVNLSPGEMSMAFWSKESGSYGIMDLHNNTPNAYTTIGSVISVREGSSTPYQYAGAIQSTNDDGFVISWTRGASIVGTQDIHTTFLAFR
jgi:hypothetical protein